VVPAFAAAADDDDDAEEAEAEEAEEAEAAAPLRSRAGAGFLALRCRDLRTGIRATGVKILGGARNG